MPDIAFAAPEAGLLLLLVPGAAIAYVLMQKRRAAAAVRFTNLALLETVAERSPAWRRHVPAAVFLAGMACLFAGLARPQTTTKVPVEEATIILTIDVSGSMISKDVEPTRLGAAQSSAKTFIDALPPKIRVGLVAFSDNVRVLSAPTTDRVQVDAAIDRLTPQRGTAMGDGLLTALEQVRPDEVSLGRGGAIKAAPDGVGPDPTKRIPAAIVLLSDGKNTVGEVEPVQAAQFAKTTGVPIYSISLGTQEGVAILPGQDGQLQRFPVPPDESTLRTVAEITGGAFFRAPSAKDLRSIYKDLGSKIGYKNQLSEVTWISLAAGTALLVVCGGLSLAWERKLP